MPIRTLLCLLAGLAIAPGCTTDPMNGTDGVSPAAGLAQEHNANAHIIDRHAGQKATANPGASGKRAAQVIEAYNNPEGE